MLKPQLLWMTIVLCLPLAAFAEEKAAGKPDAASPAASAPSFGSFKDAYAAANQALKDRRFEEAVDAYGAAEDLATSPKGKSQAANAQGWAYYKARKLAEAKKALLRAVEESGDNKLALKNLGAVEFDMYEYGLAGVEDLKDAVKNLEASGENQEELDRAKAAVGREEGYAQATPVTDPATSGLGYKELLALSDKLQDQGQFEAALRVLKQAEKKAVSPSAKGAAVNRQGKVLLDARRPVEAVPYFDAAVKYQPNEKVFLNNQGWGYWSLYNSGRGKEEALKKSVEAFYKMNSIDPSYHSENLKSALDELKEVDPEAAKAYTVKDESDEGAKDEASSDDTKAGNAQNQDSKNDGGATGDSQ